MFASAVQTVPEMAREPASDKPKSKPKLPTALVTTPDAIVAMALLGVPVPSASYVGDLPVNGVPEMEIVQEPSAKPENW